MDNELSVQDVVQLEKELWAAFPARPDAENEERCSIFIRKPVLDLLQKVAVLRGKQTNAYAEEALWRTMHFDLFECRSEAEHRTTARSRKRVKVSVKTKTLTEPSTPK